MTIHQARDVLFLNYKKVNHTIKNQKKNYIKTGPEYTSVLFVIVKITNSLFVKPYNQVILGYAALSQLYSSKHEDHQKPLHSIV